MVTQQQIAQKVGLSRQLVSFALAGYPQVGQKSRARILAVAHELGYRPNPHARALKRQRTGIIALWVPDQISTHYNHVARELNRLVKQAEHELIVSEVQAAEAREFSSNVPVDGIIAVDAPKQVEAYLKTAVAKRIPIIGIGAHYTAKADFVRVDLRAGVREMMAHLIGAGFRRIAHATFVRPNQPQADRRLGYVEAMRQAGLKPEFIYYPLTERQRPVTRRLIQDYVAKHGCPEAIFSHSDDAALGIYRGLCDLGLRMPGEVALAGCDGIEDTEYLEHPLTTLVQPVAAMCTTAWQYLAQRLEEPGLKPQQAVLSPQLVVRESSRRPVPARLDRRKK
jgi:LacI family transcriptional regulator